ncbi:hypothetical protein [Emticicia sp. TH156]|nr:hypothetical protein [Emticicia sp. TH156]
MLKVFNLAKIVLSVHSGTDCIQKTADLPSDWIISRAGGRVQNFDPRAR